MDPLTIGLTLAAKYAPDVIKYFSGSEKAANVAAGVIDIAQTVTGVGGEAADAVLAADPAKALEFKTKLLDADVELAKAQAADVMNARHMQEVALQQDDIFSKRFVYYFASAWSLFTMFYATLVTFLPPDDEVGKSNASIVLGFLLGTAVASIFSYFFGGTTVRNATAKLQSMLAKK